jgi:hypothetical protein
MEYSIAMGNRMKPSSICFRVGGTAWILLLGLALLSFIAQHIVHYGIQPAAWPALEFTLGGGGVLCFMVGAILSLWER